MSRYLKITHTIEIFSGFKNIRRKRSYTWLAEMTSEKKPGLHLAKYDLSFRAKSAKEGSLSCAVLQNR